MDAQMMEEGAGEARVSSIEDEEREEAQKKALREQVNRIFRDLDYITKE
jgi:hypothetical protein